MTDRQRLTLACFLAYFLMSAMLAPIGIVSTPLADVFGMTVTEMTGQFSALTFGILVGAVLALGMGAATNFRWVFVGLYLTMAITLAILSSTNTLFVFRAGLFLMGTGCGVGLAAAATTVSRLYEGNYRASALVATDGFFSVAGILTPWLATRLLGAGIAPGIVYLCIAIVAVAIILLTISSRFPDASGINGSEDRATPLWPLSAWLGIAALTTYTLGQYSIVFWLPAHLDATYGIPVAEGGMLVSQFWTGMFIAQILVSILVLRIGTRALLAIAACATALGTIPIWQTGEIGALRWWVLGWGIANLGLLKLALTFVTLQFTSPSPRLVSCVLLGATLGTAISPSVTSTLVEHWGTGAALRFATGCHTMMAVLLFIALLSEKKSLK